jgi:tRNA (adenine57-N1/adenine58-N1)-methyltransferase
VSVFKEGDIVQITDTKGRMYRLQLKSGNEFHTHRGHIPHNDIIGKSEGSVITSSNNNKYLAFKPLLLDQVLSMKRGAAVIYPKDSATILVEADIFPGAHVVEAGAGSGGLSLFLLRAIGQEGKLVSCEIRADFAQVARENVERIYGENPSNWELVNLDFNSAVSTFPDASVDRIILDMLAPWECFQSASRILKPGGVLAIYVATTTQMSRSVETLRILNQFAEPRSGETLVRLWHVEGLSVRPEHRMSGHTGFIITARRLAAGAEGFALKRKPAPGAYGEDWTAPNLPDSQ